MKRAMKKLSCLLLIACMLFGCVSPVYAESYQDCASWKILTDNNVNTKKNVIWYTRKNWSYEAYSFPWKIKSVKSSNSSCVKITKVNIKDGFFIFKSKKKGKVKITMSTNKGKKYLYVVVDGYLKPERRQLTINGYIDDNSNNRVISLKYSKSDGKYLYAYVWDGMADHKITKKDIMYEYANAYAYLKVSVDGKVVYNKKVWHMPVSYDYNFGDMLLIKIKNTKGKHKIVISRCGTTKVVYINIK